MKPSHVRVISQGLVGCAILMILSLSGHAQPSLHILKTSVNWPEVTLTIAPTCNSLRSYDWSPAQLDLAENGTLVSNVQVTCPDTSTSQLLSLALVLDASGSMSGSGNAGAIAMGHHLVDNKMGILDEAAIFHFTSIVTKAQEMTSDHTLLNAAISALSSGGSTACWDGIYAGLQELVTSSNNPSRCLIVLTDGDDNSSTHTPQQIIAFAQANGIKVFTIGLGSFSGSIGDLTSIAQNTGGVHRGAPTAGHLIPIIDEIWNMLDYEPCTVRYTSSCEDGKSRAVTLRLNNFCGGSPLANFTFQAPYTPSTFVPIHFSLDTLDTPQQAEVRMTLRLTTPELGLLAPCNGQIDWDRRYLDFLRYEPDLDPAIMGFNPTIQKGYDLLTFSSGGDLPILRDGTLGTLVFRSIAIPDTVTTPVELTSWTFQHGCREPKVYNGQVRIFGGFTPKIFASGKLEFCEGDSVILTAQPGFLSYLWSNGKTDQSIVVSSSGIYTVKAFAAGGKAATSEPVVITTFPKPSVVINPPGPLVLCPGGSLTLTSGNYASFTWSTGATSPSISVRNGGVFFVTATDQNGCTSTSAPVEVRASTAVAEISPKGPVVLCKGDTALLTAKDGYSAYQWNSGQTTHEVRITQSGMYIVMVTDSLGCSVVSQPVRVDVLDIPPPPISLDRPNATLCEGDTLRMTAGPGYASYAWSTGETSPSIAVTTAGSFDVLASAASGCSARSLPVIVTVHPRPTPSIVPDKVPRFCQGDTVSLDAGASFASYQWSTGATTREIAVSTSGSFFVTVTSAEGCAATSPPLVVEVLPNPPQPTFGWLGPTLHADPATAWQWYLNGAPIPGGTGRLLKPLVAGRYEVVVFDANGCSSRSAALDVVLAIENLPGSPSTLHVYPDPADQDIVLTFTEPGLQSALLEVRDILGRRVLSLPAEAQNGEIRLRLPLHGLVPGHYLVMVHTIQGIHQTLFRKR